MTVRELLEKAKELNVEIRVDNGVLLVRRGDRLPKEYADELRNNRDLIISAHSSELVKKVAKQFSATIVDITKGETADVQTKAISN